MSSSEHVFYPAYYLTVYPNTSPLGAKKTRKRKKQRGWPAPGQPQRILNQSLHRASPAPIVTVEGAGRSVFPPEKGRLAYFFTGGTGFIFTGGTGFIFTGGTGF
jgi:hypothetical protein